MTTPRGGALRYQREDTGEWVVANPRDPLYSTVTMCATEYWDGEAWRPIWPEDDGNTESV